MGHLGNLEHKKRLPCEKRVEKDIKLNKWIWLASLKKRIRNYQKHKKKPNTWCNLLDEIYKQKDEKYKIKAVCL